MFHGLTSSSGVTTSVTIDATTGLTIGETSGATIGATTGATNLKKTALDSQGVKCQV